MIPTKDAKPSKRNIKTAVIRSTKRKIISCKLDLSTPFREIIFQWVFIK